MENNVEGLKFRIDQLRKDKIIYVVESAALSLVALLFFFVSPLVFPTVFGINGNSDLASKIFTFILTVVFLYWFYTVVGNTKRYLKIKKLEQELK